MVTKATEHLCDFESYVSLGRIKRSRLSECPYLKTETDEQDGLVAKGKRIISLALSLKE